MPSTSRGYPYPSGSDDVDIPGDMQALAAAVNTRLSVATSGDAVVRQSRYIQYRPGKSQLVMVTGTVATSGALSWTEVR